MQKRNNLGANRLSLRGDERARMEAEPAKEKKEK